MDGMANYAPIGPELEGVSPNFSLSNMSPSFGEYFPAQAGNALRDSGVSSILRSIELEGADARQGGQMDEFGVFQPGPPVAKRRVTAEYAKGKAEQAGVTVDFGTADYTEDAVDIMIDRARRKSVRDETISSYDPSLVTSFGTSIAATLVDPINIGSAFIPFVGEARYAGMLAEASGFGARSLVRAGAGALEGFGGAALLEPAIAYAATQEGRDYTLADSLRNLAFGAAFGSGLHLGGGTFAEKVLGRTYANAPIVNPADVVDRLPQEAKIAAMKAAIADLHAGKEVQAQDIIDHLTELDPELGNAVLYAQTLKRDGPPIDDTEARIAFWEGKLSGKRTPTSKVESFAAWVRSKGGVRDIDGELEAQLGKGHGLPSSMFLTQRGAKRSERGVDFEALYLEAVNEGFVTTKQEFIDAFRSHVGGTVAPVIRRADSQAADKVAEEAEYVKAAIEQSGINPRASNKAKARAITGREQHVIAAERARVQGALARLEARREAILRGEDPEPKPEPKADENKPEPEKLPTSKEDVAEVGDTVDAVSQSGSYALGMTGVKVTHIYDDPVYGKWAMIEGSNSAIELGKLKVTKKGEKPAETLSAAVEADKKPPTAAEAAAPEYHVGSVLDAIRKTLRDKKGKATKADVLARLPGIDEKVFDEHAADVTSRELSGVAMHVKKGETTFTGKKLSPEQRHRAMLEDYRGKVNSARRTLDATFPGMAEQKTYYLQALTDQADRLSMGPDNLREFLNDELRAGRLKAVDEETGKPIHELSRLLFEIDTRDDAVGVLLTFEEGTPVRKVKPTTAKLGALSPEENAAVVADEAAKAARANVLRLEEAPVEGSLDGELAISVKQGDNEVANLKVTPQPIDKTLYVDNLISSKGKNSLGAAQMRELVDALAERFPDYEKIVAYRMTGARGKAREAGGKPKMEMELPLKKRTPAEKEAETTGEALAAAGPRSPMPDSPPAERNALTTKELSESESQAKALEAKTLKRLDHLLKTMSPETAATIRSQLAKIDGESKDLAAVYESAIQCLLRP